jgi:outer membrane protein OmpA-like peptidoglycan-associated protein
MQMTSRGATAFAGGMALLLSGACQSMGQRERGAAIGAATGAAAGAVIGTATGSTARGAVIGAVLGGAAGAVIGHQMDQQAKEIEATVPGAVVTRVGEGMVITFESGLLFDFDSDRLRAEAQRDLDNLAANFSKFGDSNLLVVGHTDATGSESYNMQLSQRRADAVANHLSARGISRSRMTITGRGPHEPVASNSSTTGQAQNRRVEIAVYASDAMRRDAATRIPPQD